MRSSKHKCRVEIWDSRRSAENGGVAVTKKGTAPQGIRFLVGMLDGGIDAAQAILDDMKNDRRNIRRRHGI